MSDITAIVLTIGEETTERAIDSLRRQTVLPEKIIVIRNVTPFHKALNLGVSKVKTEFFVQVDSDMILDEDCLEGLRECMTEDVGIAIGPLRDFLMGVITGVKMFRKKCFEKVQFENSISPDTDFHNDMEKHGWKIRYPLKSGYRVESNKFWPTFGEHRPAYTPLYTYSKYYVLGRRYRYRKDLYGIRWRLRELRRNNHSLSLFAEIALAHGIFLEDEIDLLTPNLYTRNDDFSFLEKFLRGENSYDISESNILSLLTFKPDAIYRNFYKLGIDLRRNNSPLALKYCMEVLDIDRTCFAWVAEVGLCHGIFSESYSEDTAETDYNKLKELL